MSSSNAFLVLAYGKPAQAAACLQAIHDARYRGESVFLLDNGSHPPIQNHSPQFGDSVAFLRLDENRGYAGGVNAGLRALSEKGYAGAFLLTNDTRIQEDALEACLEVAETTGAAIVAPEVRLLSDPSRIDSIGGYLDPQSATLHHYREFPAALPPLLREGDYVPGAAFWIRLDAFRAIGGFDESLFAYWEDVDLTFRLRLKGFSAARAPGARILHGRGPTNRGNPLYTTFYYQRNRFRVCRRHLPDAQWRALLPNLRQELESRIQQWQQSNDVRRLHYADPLRAELSDPQPSPNPG